ncbi:caspase family protein [Candidatus Thiosymbion oneisti]|uniref:caspase family protein n=1 Tax=Candidatus Thiosymbion oneisti TaxID=589554 RepID=UPI000AF1B6AB|nr:caspase family protein [Candidatus Thiosymbion oneisti]
MIRKWLAGSLGAAALFWLLALVFPLAAAEIPRIPFPRIETGMHTAVIKRIAVDRAERFLVTGSRDKTVRIWSLPAGELLRTLRLPIDTGDEGKVYAVAIAPDGQTIAAGGWTGVWDGTTTSIYLFDRQSGRLQHRLTGLPNVVHHLDWSPDGRYLAASLGGKNGVRIYSTQDWAQHFQDRDYGDSSYSAHFDGRSRLVTTSYDGYLRLYDKRFRLIAKQKAPGGERPFFARFSPDGERIAVGFTDSTAVNVLSASDLTLLYRPDTSQANNGSLNSVVWSQDGLQLYAGGRYQQAGSNPILRWDQAGRGAVTQLPAAESTLMDLRILSDGGLVFGAADPAWGLLDATGQQKIFKPPEIADFRGDLNNFLVAHDGSNVQFGYEPGGKRPARFSLSERRLLLLDDRPMDLADLQRGLAGLGFDPGPADGVMGARTRAAIRAFQRTQGLVVDGKVDPGLAQAVEAAALGLKPPRTKTPGLDISDWKNRYHPKLNGKRLKLQDYERSRSLAIAPDGKRFLLGTEWWLRLFDRTGKQLRRIPVPGVAWGVNITGNGQLAVAAFGDGTIRWYRLRDGAELLALFPHQDGKRWVAWTPAGFYLASAGGEDLVGWHVNRGRDQAADFYGASRFRQQFYRPDVIARVLETLDVDQALRQADAARGQKTVTRDVLRLRPPVVSILAPAAGSPITETKLTLTYEARSETGPIERIEARLDGRPARILTHDQNYRDQRQQVIGQLSLEIPPSEATVSIIARNRHGTSEPASFAINWTGSKDWYKPTLYVLAVGVSDYQEDTLNLKFASKDAQDFRQAIEHQKKRGLYRDVKTKLLDDRKATREAVLDGLDWLERQTTSRDVAILYLAGHGITGPQGHYRFLPHDTDQGRLRRTTLKDTDFKDFLGAVAGKTILFLDTCFSGRVLGGRADSQADVDRFANELADAETGVIVFSSSTGKQLSQEDDKWGNGAFTEALLEGIREGKADFIEDLHVSVAELEVYVSNRVKSLTQGAQKPVTTKPEAVEDLKIVRIRK